jgi:hypothetical protein
MEASMSQYDRHRRPFPSRRHPARWSAIGLALLLALAPVAAFAQHGDAHFGGGPRMGGPNMHMDGRFAHNQYYFNRGFAVHSPPPGREFIGRDGLRYWYGGGNWYRWGGGSWIVGAAPFGVFVPALPPYYSTIWWAGVPYYYANDTYYLWNQGQNGYEVVEPPQGIEQQATTQPPGSNQIFVYPRNGQTDAQQSNDRYECHRWAVGQTGFDPTVAGGGVPQGQTSDARDRYFRAQVACLQARGYSVE